MIDKIFLEELKINDIGKLNFPDYADELMIIHGTEDEIIYYISFIKVWK